MPQADAPVMATFLIPLGPTRRMEGANTWIGRNLMQMGHTVKYNGNIASPEQWGDYDAQVYIDWGEDCFNVAPTFVSHPSLCWMSDTHMARSSYLFRLNQSKAYDHVLVAQPDCVKQFAGDGVKASWMPHAVEHNLWCPPLLHHKPRGSWSYMKLPPDPMAIDSLTVERIPIYDFCFIGHLGLEVGVERTDCISALFDAFENWAWESGTFYEQAVDVYHKSKIVFNRSVCKDLNMRTFEALSSRSFMLTDKQNGMDELGLRDGEHCAMYETTGEAIEKMAYWLDPARDKKRKDIAYNGWEWVLKNHTYWHRARTICEIMGIDTVDSKG